MKIIVANWKLNPLSAKKAIFLAKKVRIGVKKLNVRSQIIICPPFTYIPLIKKILGKTRVRIGAQDLFWIDEGPFTSAISGVILKNLGCKYVIVGHSERRLVFQDSNEVVSKKIRAALRNKLHPILCIGEQLKEKKSGETFSVLRRELREGLNNVSQKEIRKVIIGYEPIWAVGASHSATPEEITKINLFIRKIISRLYDKNTSKKIKILYGGSVNPHDIKSIISKTKVNGFLIGRASLQPNQFMSILKSL